MFFSCDGIDVQIAVSKGKSVTDRYYRDVLLNKLMNNFLCQDLRMFVYSMIMPHRIHIYLVK